MNDYIELKLIPSPCNETITDVLAALLADEGYESFVPSAEDLIAYIPVEKFSESRVASVLEQFPMPDVAISCHSKFVEGQDWNSEWEKNYFKPIVVADRCVIHSSFHTDVPEAEYDIVIDPKMAFGTGHHQTTSLILARLLDLDLHGKHLIDVGTGTGVLAILAAMRGASSVDAIEIDGFAIVNAQETVERNNVNVNLIHGDASKLAQLPEADYLLANINRNIIVADLPAYARAIKSGATAIFSGFYVEDVDIIAEAAGKVGLKLLDVTERDRWASVAMIKE
ncbi:MAG: 50S ribosomal protein L11 methyltransferase [Muribaculaceae bacterium]|nr:50S ribosomal protein L11 methyltransferase [Muribaculaceae bacterium]MDE7393247.1 50S ribosomal protein L11 methyltransferase [Muribaculaceae bacterium]